MKQKFLLIASLAIGLLAAILAHAWLTAKKAEVNAERQRIIASQRTVSVVAATRPLPQGTILKHEDIGLQKTFERTTTSDNIPAADAMRLIGRKISHTVEKGDPILWTYLDGGRDFSRKLSDEIPQGMRAVSIPVSGAAAVSGLVRPNDHVDVLGMFSLPDGAAKLGAQSGEDLVTMTVLQNVTVLATGAETARTPQGRNQQGYSTVTLLVTPREAEVLVFAQQMKGRLFLSLRNSSDVHFESEMPRVDFNQIEGELKSLNNIRQDKLNHGVRRNR